MIFVKRKKGSQCPIAKRISSGIDFVAGYYIPTWLLYYDNKIFLNQSLFV